MENLHMMIVCIPYQLQMVINHLKTLSEEDKRLRFGSSMKDEALQAMVEKLYASGKVKIYYMYTSKYKVVASLFVGAVDKKTEEFAVTVSEAYRGKGLAQKMMADCIRYSKIRGVEKVVVQCAKTNVIMKHIAKKFECNISTTHDDHIGEIELKSKRVAKKICSRLYYEEKNEAEIQKSIR